MPSPRTAGGCDWVRGPLAAASRPEALPAWAAGEMGRGRPWGRARGEGRAVLRRVNASGDVSGARAQGVEPPPP